MIVANNIQKNKDLPIGTILQLNGYNDPQYCVVGKTESKGETILDTINIDTFARGRHETWSLIPIEEKTSNRIQMYFTKQIYTPAMIVDLILKANDTAIKAAIAKDQKMLRDEQEKAKLIAEYPYLTTVAKGGTASKNIKKELKHAYPNVKFSVRYEHHGCVRIEYSDKDLSAKDVQKIANKYQSGDFNAMEDIYEYSSSNWHIFGSERYVFTYNTSRNDI